METVLFTVTARWSDRTFELSSDTFGRSISANELAAVHGKSTRGRAIPVSIPNWLIASSLDSPCMHRIAGIRIASAPSSRCRIV